MLQQGTFAGRADALDLVERVPDDVLLATRAMRADGKAVSLVAEALDKVENRIAVRQHEGVLALHEEFLAAGVALLALGDADEDHFLGQLQLGDHFSYRI